MKISLGHGKGSITYLSDNKYSYNVRLAGKRHQRKFEALDEKKAIIHAKQILDELLDRDRDYMISVNELVSMYDQYLSEYIPRRRLHITATVSRPVSDVYYNTILQKLRNFILYLKARKINQICDIKLEVVMAYIRQLRSSSASFNTYNSHLAHFRHIFNVIPFFKGYAENLKGIPGKIATAKVCSKQPFTPAELILIFDASEKLLESDNELKWIWFAVRAGFFSSLRLSDVITLKYSEVESDGFIEHVDRKTGKGDLLYSPELVEVIENWIQYSEVTDDYILPLQSSTYLGTRKAFAKNNLGKKPRKIKPNRTKASKQFMTFLGSLNIDTRNEDNRTIKGFHSLRVTHATYCRIGGLTLEEIREKLKHTSSETTQLYIQLSREEQKELLKKNYNSNMFKIS